jgi:DNA-binding NarL/FixJ family response regulator
LTGLLKEYWPHVRVVVLAEAQAPDQVGRALAAGAADCVSLDCSADELIDAIAAAAARSSRLAEVCDV